MKNLTKLFLDNLEYFYFKQNFSYLLIPSGVDLLDFLLRNSICIAGSSVANNLKNKYTALLGNTGHPVYYGADIDVYFDLNHNNAASFLYNQLSDTKDYYAIDLGNLKILKTARTNNINYIFVAKDDKSKISCKEILNTFDLNCSQAALTNAEIYVSESYIDWLETNSISFTGAYNNLVQTLARFCHKAIIYGMDLDSVDKELRRFHEQIFNVNVAYMTIKENHYDALRQISALDKYFEIDVIRTLESCKYMLKVFKL